MDGGAWWAAVHGVAKSRTRLSDFTLTFHFHALKKEVATHSSVKDEITEIEWVSFPDFLFNPARKQLVYCLWRITAELRFRALY